MDPSQNPGPSSGRQSEYVLERPLGQGCKFDINADSERDNRYAKIDGYSISEFDLLN